MSVNTSEEYLDELLQAIEPIIYPDGPEPVEEPEVAVDQQTIVMPETGVESVSATVPETIMEPETIAEPEEDNSAAIDDLLASLALEDNEEANELGMSEEDIESVLSAVSNSPVEESDNSAYDQDVKELLKQFTEDEDLSDIQDMLDKNDNGEAVDESLLEIPDVEVFQLEEESDEDGEDQTDFVKKENVVGKLVGGFVDFFKKRKEKKQKATEATGNSMEADEPAESREENDFNFEAGLSDIGEELLDDSISDADVEELVLDEDLSDIEELLLGGAISGADTYDAGENTDEGIEENTDKKSARDKKKSRKEKREKKDKKESIFSKVLNMLTEEVDESAQSKATADGGVPEADETGITNENLNILEELSKEDKKKAKKEAKQDQKKAKKNGKNASKKDGGDEKADGKGAKGKAGKKPKKEKKKREKKEKPRKVEVISKPEKKLPRKRVLSIFALCFSILAAILILQNVVIKVDNLKEAQFAYDNADYETCYANLSGVERSEEEETLYQRSFIILTVQRKLDSYNNFMQMNNETEALNSLLEGVVVYKEQQEAATEWGVLEKITAIYQTIREKLEIYGLSEADVEEILGYESKVTYTKRLDSIINGTPFVIEDNITIEEAQPLQDVLPGEEDFLPEDTTDVTSGQALNDAGETFATEESVGAESSTSQGNTVVVGSNPVEIPDTDAVITAGENVGSGSTDVSIELNDGNVVVSDM